MLCVKFIVPLLHKKIAGAVAMLVHQPSKIKDVTTDHIQCQNKK